jgi:glycosyltransferase involved in cell wall biosynthesis
MAIQQRGISDYLKLLGRRDDVHELMQVSSLLLLTSSFEGTPNVVMEAQALGVPVVATKVGGVADIVVDGETGFLADKDDEAGLADRCVRILLDKTIRVRMGMAAKSRMAKLFSVETMVKQYLELIPGDGRTSAGLQTVRQR